jgi:hypothetical protein
VSHPDPGSRSLINVALLVTPPLLRGIVTEALVSVPEVRLVDPPPVGGAPRSPYDVIVISLQDIASDEKCWQMLARYPQARVIALGGDATDAFLYEMRPHRSELGELSPGALRHAIRGRSGES